MASTAATTPSVNNRAALWVKPSRIAAAGAAAMAISALLLFADSSFGGPREPTGILKKDTVPVAVLPSQTMAREPVMRREPKTPTPAAPERPAEWGGLMRREAKVVVPLAADGDASKMKTSSGFGTVMLCIVAVLALAGFAQQARTALAQLLEQPEIQAMLGKGKAK
eukprot:gb/GFBE01046999.1/.p1 GENE.gb/GFBE01046999.1/~~gb/GFBE01046999.1/.p1  ORF type:complete len:167 (+),score=39.92 gb/GFBE01046999.1/:1-501(+)